MLIFINIQIFFLQQGNLAELQATLRMPLDVYRMLLSKVKPIITKKHTSFRKPISAKVRLAVTLRFLALGDGFRSLSQQFRIGLSTAREIVKETCKAIIIALQDQYLSTPTSREEWLAIAKEFQERWHFPHCLGAIDGKHIRMIQPPRSGSYFYNYKGYYSIVLLAIANGEYEFTYVDIGAEGKCSDGGTWRKCTFHEYLYNPQNPLNIPPPEQLIGINRIMPYVLVGDDAFRMTQNLLKPFPGTHLTRQQEIYNYRLSRCRRIVENTFGILTTRFRVFQRTLEVHPNFVQDIVMASCVLHNFLHKEGKSVYIPVNSVDQEMTDGTVVDGEWRQEMVGLDSVQRDPQRNPSQYAKKIRTRLSDYFLTEEGEVEWQYNLH